MLRLFFAGCALGAACIVSNLTLARAGSAPQPSPSPTGLAEIGRVVTSDRRSEPIDRTSRPTFVITRAQLDALGARTLADALGAVPGVKLFRYGPFGGLVDYGIRGSSSEQTLVLLDGAPIADVSSGDVDLGTFPLTGVERIEIVESGASTLYGTSASGGVINIITAATHHAEAVVAAGSYGEADVRFGAGDGRIGISVERHVAADAFAYPAFDYAMQNFAPGIRANDWAEQSSARLTADEPLGGYFRLRADLGVDGIHAGVPGRLDFLTPNAVQSTARTEAMLELTHDWAHSSFTITASGARSALAYADPDNGGESDTYDGRAQLSLKEILSAGDSTLVAGVDVARESALLSLGASGPPPSFNASESQTATYVQDQWSITPAVQTTFGLRAENDAPRGAVLAPTFGALARTGAFRIAGNVGESFRVPTLIDLYYPNFSNPNLVAEKARNADVTVGFASRGGDVSLGWFDRYGSNFIVLDENFVPQNAERAGISGLMLTVASRPFAGLIADASVTDVYRALNLVTGARLPRNPVMQATLGLTRPFGAGDVAFGIRAKVVGSDGDTAFGAGGNVYDAYTTLDAYLRVKLARDVVLSVRGRNLGDERYTPVLGYPAQGRTFEVELATH